MSAKLVAGLDHVVKEYRLEHERSNLRNLIPGERGVMHGEMLFRALDDVSFHVGEGEAVGIVGANGAGKSTALKLLARVLEPSAGRVWTRGRVASLIELGVGFDPDLSGRENILFAGQMLGLSRKEIRDHFDSIVDFSGMEHFLEMPLKRYSTGMAARLGFSIASAVQPDLLVVDEVLSVGDYEFQRKSLERVRDLHREGAALLLVSHSLWMMHALCDRLLLLHEGRLVADGPAADVLAQYLGPDILAGEEVDPDFEVPTYVDYTVPSVLRHKVTIDRIEASPRTIKPGGPIAIRARVTVREPIDGLLVMSIYTAERAVFAEREAGPATFLRTPGTWTVEAQVASVPLNTGTYIMRFAVLPSDDRHFHQEFPAALAIGSAEFTIDGGMTARPGIVVSTNWSVERLLDENPQGGDRRQAEEPSV